MLETADGLNSCAAAVSQFTCSSLGWGEARGLCKRVWGDSARCHFFLSKPWDVPTEPDAAQAACEGAATFAALSISRASEN